MTKIINLFGGPGCGKSTIASGIFHKMKKKNISCELISEFAKDIVWEESDKLLGNQIFIFAEQFRRQFRLINKVNYVVTDSPLLLSSIYYNHYTLKNTETFFSEDYNTLLCKVFDRTFLEFENINIMIERPEKYETEGRIQSEEEAREIDKLIFDKLKLQYNQEVLYWRLEDANKNIKSFVKKLKE